MLSDPFSSAAAEVLISQAPDFVGIYDVAEGWFMRINPAGVRLLGYPSEEAFLADPARVLPTPTVSPARWAHLRKLARRVGPQALEAEVGRRQGPSFWGRIELTAFQVKGADYLLVRLSEQGRLQQAERELAQSVRRFEAVFTHATIGIVVCDERGRIVSANQLAHQLFGYAADALEGQLIELLVPQAAGRRHEKLRESFTARPQVRTMGGHSGELHGLRHDGSVFPVEVSLSYFHLDEELYAVSYILDITYKKEFEQQLIAGSQRVAALNADLEQRVTERTHALMNTLEQLQLRKNELAKALAAERELGELKSRFVSMASHEFRTPLTAVLTSAALIEEYPATEQQPKRLRHIERIRTSVKHLNDILEEFLSVGRIEEGKIEAHPARLDLPALLRDVVADVQGLRKPGQRIEQTTDCPEPIWLDPSLLRKILVNLLSNALKYSGENTVVAVAAACQAGALTLTVADQGVGISEEDQAHLFERFFRARNVTNVPGTGLGLYIIARYLELLHGHIALQSALGQGTTVTITVPYENHSAD
ncbi:PAS domain-containing sensor histidine kinase [Hymenobacter sp. UV11]|uniref:sensor histidine kinase n=1 Tax=Hymenobacter sp. UV11 TaxID=1849735 RepID=UPI001060E51B|nr:PAS domain-containing sensor histidine kinase [Hymenobacter sp. UV11]TDN36876.1 PAS domain-containing sensor histidine kinase [Hymenobacter sp. UV11]TFZ66317.1 PAS domain-containing sensor histidine kinase [Hymenobacter sp. UV11]